MDAHRSDEIRSSKTGRTTLGLAIVSGLARGKSAHSICLSLPCGLLQSKRTSIGMLSCWKDRVLPAKLMIMLKRKE